jgi:hypothetical protein
MSPCDCRHDEPDETDRRGFHISGVAGAPEEAEDDAEDDRETSRRWCEWSVDSPEGDFDRCSKEG